MMWCGVLETNSPTVYRNVEGWSGSVLKGSAVHSRNVLTRIKMSHEEAKKRQRRRRGEPSQLELSGLMVTDTVDQPTLVVGSI